MPTDTDQPLADFFAGQLSATAAAFVWAVEQLPPDKLFRSSPRHPEDWPAARHAFHLVHYERTIALPSLRQWLGGPPPDSAGQEEDAAREEEEWRALVRPAADVRALLARFRAVRAEQVGLVSRFAPQQWDERRACLWGEVPLRWVVTKTLQHTHEHTHDVLRPVLWWAMPPVPKG